MYKPPINKTIYLLQYRVIRVCLKAYTGKNNNKTYFKKK